MQVGDVDFCSSTCGEARIVALDAAVGRQAWDTLDDVAAEQKAGRLAPIVLIHTGNNGIISPQQLTTTLSLLEDRQMVLLVNDYVGRSWEHPNNATLAATAKEFPNVTLIDWNAAAAKNSSWLGSDGIHVNGTGAKGYAGLVTAALK